MVKGFSFQLLAWLWAVPSLAAFPDCKNGPLKDNKVCDMTADALERATSLIKLFTVEEKINNTGNTSPGVPRLGLPAYQWWSEALHGVAHSPGVKFSKNGNFSYATSFPQPITMGAAFDDALIKDVATIISTEARAFSNAGRTGLDFWTPNINPFRDPRWGRGQETPGEDPFHLSSYVHALIDGLQGNTESRYKRIVATCKHYAGYDIEQWQGNARFGFNAVISPQDLVEYYMPPFQECARDSNVGAFMCSYNAVNGVPACADPYLLQTILREKWNWSSEQQWVTSDCDAVANVFTDHHFTKTPEEAVAESLKAGTDVDCGPYYQKYLPNAYKQGLFNDSVLDMALIRQYSSLIRLGYFDPAEAQPYRSVGFDSVATEGNLALAKRAAVEGMVLLKNDGLLPLSIKNKPKISLLGDWANATTQMQGNYKGTAPFLTSPLAAAQNLSATVTYASTPEAAKDADVIIYIGGIDNHIEAEDLDRNSISWNASQLSTISTLSSYGKKMLVVQMGGGQVDSSAIKANANISALIWAGYPGQAGGTALFDIITGVSAPAGRLPITQYPASYVDAVPMTDMALRPGPKNPGRTYKWYTGKPVFEFGHGLHYTKFSASIVTEGGLAKSYSISDLMSKCKASIADSSSGVKYADKCALGTVHAAIKNKGNVTSDYVALGFLAGQFGPAPHPKKSLVAYTRLSDIAGGASQTADLDLTLGSLARVEDNGKKVLYPGTYKLEVDNGPLTSVTFTLTGEKATLDEWPVQKNQRPHTAKGVGKGNGYQGPNPYQAPIA
ncbi:glycoside hydrolase [Microthyrium microscopicum]|uniref:xylan 1,4-beta-xylosidase n=1 Tax=Microthyrium microscopicum TaxID=703497 RepID=A0A6A6UBD7_9PEZI|nr:glycoside hydrolase [Microthyrium microscopicum]